MRKRRNGLAITPQRLREKRVMALRKTGNGPAITPFFSGVYTVMLPRQQGGGNANGRRGTQQKP